MLSRYIFNFKDIIEEDINTVGEKAITLAKLSRENINIPEGFAVTSHAFDEFVKKNKLHIKANHLVKTSNHRDPYSITQVSKHIRKHFNDGVLPSDLKLQLYNEYKKLGRNLSDTHVKIILSPPSSNHNFDHDPWDEVKGEASLIHSIKSCWSSNFSEINLIKNHNESFYTKSVVVARIINAEKSGKIYTVDPESKDKNKIIITSMLGEYSHNINLVLMPDTYEIDKKTGDIISTEEVPQKKMKIGKLGSKKVAHVPSNLKSKKKLTEKEIKELVNYAKNIEKVFYFPQVIDWSIENGKLYVTDTRHMTFL
jgi:pyruvate, water dikinase